VTAFAAALAASAPVIVDEETAKKRAAREAKRHRGMEQRIMEASALVRYPANLVKFWDKCVQWCASTTVSCSHSASRGAVTRALQVRANDADGPAVQEAGHAGREGAAEAGV
jgi:hypothetical protein